MVGLRDRADMHTAAFHEIETASGLFFDLAKPHPRDVALYDIAQGLSCTARYGGQASEFYSVAQHAYVVAQQLKRRNWPVSVQLAGLHHDDPEAYIGDIPRPLKSLLPEYRALEREVWRAIAEAIAPFPLPIDSDAVKEADTWALSYEAHYLMPSMGIGWFCEGYYERNPYNANDPGPLTPWPHDVAREIWLDEHETLMSEFASSEAVIAHA